MAFAAPANQTLGRRLRALLAFLLCAASARAQTSAELLSTGDQSARKGKFTEALTSWKRAYERRFGAFRDVPFIYPVEASFLTPGGLRDKLIEEFRKELPDEKALAEQKALAAFGFFAPDLDLKQTMLDLLSEEVAGFYDPDSKRLYLIKEGGEEDRRVWWKKLLGSGFDPEEQKMILVHEMSHALMDQHHDLLSLHRSAEHDDDMALALAGLIEGEATLCMLVGPGQNKDLLTAPAGAIEFSMRLTMPFMAFASGPTFRRAPPVIRETLLFPYLNGLTFCLSLTGEEATWAPVERAFARPPLSTEQVLHPERYAPGDPEAEDAPVRLEFAPLSSALGLGWTEVRSNVLGEWMVRLLLDGKLSRNASEEAADGWDGDFYRVYQREKELLLAWASLWDDPREAGEFEEALEKLVAARRGEEAQDGEGLGLDRSRLWRSEGRVTALLREGELVWFLDGAPAGAFAEAVKTVRRLKREPKRFELKKAKPEVEFPAERRIRAERL